MKKALLGVISLGFAVSAGLSPSIARAADLVEERMEVVAPEPVPQWEATIAPFYTWLPGLHGTIGAFGVETSVDVTAGDLIRNLDEVLHALDGIYFGTGQINYGDFGFFYDIAYLDLSSVQRISGSRSRTFDLGSGPLGAADLTLTATASVDGVVDAAFAYKAAVLAGTYRFYETPQTYVDALLGARLTEVDIDLSVVADITVVQQFNLSIGGHDFVRTNTFGNQVQATLSDGDHWIDAVAGISGKHYFTDNFYMNGWAMGGAGQSDYVYDLMAGLGYQWNNGWSLYGGWRVVGTQYQADTFTWDIVMSGPVMGLSIKF